MLIEVVDHPAAISVIPQIHLHHAKHVKHLDKLMGGSQHGNVDIFFFSDLKIDAGKLDGHMIWLVVDLPL